MCNILLFDIENLLAKVLLKQNNCQIIILYKLNKNLLSK